MSVVRALALVICVALAMQLGCADSTAPQPGELTLVLETPNSGDRSVVVRISGPGASNVVAASPGYTVHARVTGGELRAAIFGALANGPVLRFSVPEVNRSAEYSATVSEVGDESDQLRATLTAYRAIIVRN